MNAALSAAYPSRREVGKSDVGWLESEKRSDGLSILIGGSWTFDHVVVLEEHRRSALALIDGVKPGQVSIDIDTTINFDTSGAWLLHRLKLGLVDSGWKVTIGEADPKYRAFLQKFQEIDLQPSQAQTPPNSLVRLIASLGQNTVEAIVKGGRLLSFFGETVSALLRTLIRPSRLRLTSLTHHIEQTCLHALPIVGLIAFLLGVVMAYQGADQLKRFGAEIFTVDLVGISILREIGILLTAIVVAGRSGSAFTAEIGAMAVNQEIDALRTLGLDPIDVLVMPRMLALMVALPLLAFLADILGLVGGGLMAWMALDISPSQFISQLNEAIEPATFWVGIVKAPVFAFVIAMVGCYEGLSVSGGADAVGRHTTTSVVSGIFLVIVFDALFSILFSYLGV